MSSPLSRGLGREGRARSPLSALLLLFCLSATLLLLGQSFRPAFGSGSNQTSANRASDGTDVHRLIQKAEGDGRVRVIVQLDVPYIPERHLSAQGAARQRNQIAGAQTAVLGALADAGVFREERFELFPLLVLEVNADGLKELLVQDRVASVVEDQPIPPALTESIPIVGADQVWLQGADGAGYLVAVLDTGVDLDHPFLAGKIASEACFSTTSSFYGSTTLCPSGAEQEIGAGAAAACSISNCSHGTHVSGIAVGDGANSGVAKGADLIAVQVFSRFDGSICPFPTIPCLLSFTSDQLQALEWIYGNRESYGQPVAAINMSLGSRNTDPSACDTDSRAGVIGDLRDAGIGTVIASGNSYATDGLSVPACISSAISVSATENDDDVAAFANVGEILDFFAPGVGITSSVPGGGFGSKSGTSMAAPHVAGALALLRSASPTADLETILTALAETGAIITDDRTGGTHMAPRIQIDQAVEELPEPTPTPASTIYFPVIQN